MLRVTFMNVEMEGKTLIYFNPSRIMSIATFTFQDCLKSSIIRESKVLFSSWLIKFSIPMIKQLKGIICFVTLKH